MGNITCKNCGYTWPNSLVGGTNAKNITFKNVNTSCPRCGSTTPIFEDGTYDFDEAGVAKLLRQIPRRDLDKLRLAAIGIRDSGGTAQDLHVAMSEINSAYSPLYTKMMELSKDENFRHWIDRLIKVIGILVGGALGVVAIGNITINHQTTNVTNNINYGSPAPTPDTSYSKSFERDLREKNLKAIKLNKEKIDSTKATKKR
jgi:hypothetical protein